MLESYFDGLIQDAADREDFKVSLIDEVTARYDDAMREANPTAALRTIWDVVAEANRYLVERAPWALAKDPDRRAELEAVLYASAELLRIIAVYVSPIMPAAAARLWEQLGVAERLEDQRLPGSARWGLLDPGTRIRRGDPLFPRLDD